MPPKKAESGEIYSATYSNVPVYEFNCNGNHVMRRRVDNWINATHILKVANFDKPARTRILEREVQKGTHEKIQGGYGKYQGTWVPLEDGRDLAHRNHVLPILLPIFDYVPGDHSPPQAPKHTTAASNKPKVPKVTAAAARKAQKVIAPPILNDDQFNEEDTPDNSTIMSGEVDEDDLMPYSQQSATSRKRKRGPYDIGHKGPVDREHQMYGDELLDYFMLSGEQDETYLPPMPPPNFKVNHSIDNFGHAALHWAACMGDIDICKDLLNRGADVGVLNDRGETPLMRATQFTNNFEMGTMPKLVNLLQHTVAMTDHYNGTVFHHIAMTTSHRNKGACARYYQESIINKLSETSITDEIRHILDAQNFAGDTALHIAARNGSKKVCRSLQGHSASSDIPNKDGELAGHMLAALYARNSGGSRDPLAAMSSSPYQPASANLFATSQNSEIQPSTIASTMISTILPLIHEKTATLSAAIANEAREKDTQHAEALRLLKNTQKQTAELRQAIYDFPAEKDDALARVQREDVARLEAEVEAVIEQSQWSEIRDAFLTEPPALSSSSLAAQPDGGRLSPEAASEKAAAAMELLAAQEERKTLVREMIKAAGLTGTNEKTSEYRKLIAIALDETEDKIMEQLPDILKSMEDMSEANGVTPTAATWTA